MDTLKTIVIALVAALAVGLVVIVAQPDQNVGGAPGVNLIPSQGLKNQIALTVDTDYTLSHYESGSVIYASTTFGTTTLPQVRAGLEYTFQVNQAIATGNWIIDSYEGDNIEGTLIVAGAVVDCRGEDQINFVTDGEAVGDYVTLRSDGTSWLIDDSGVLTSAKMTCTDPT